MYPRYSELDLRWSNTLGKWVLYKPLMVFYVGPHSTARCRAAVITWVVPRGTSTDLASIPGIGRLLFKTWGTWTCPAVEHDYNYSTGRIQRKTADRRLLLGTKAEQFRYRVAQGKDRPWYRLASWLARWAIYSHVRMYGWLAWNGYRRKE